MSLVHQVKSIILGNLLSSDASLGLRNGGAHWSSPWQGHQLSSAVGLLLESAQSACTHSLLLLTLCGTLTSGPSMEECFLKAAVSSKPPLSFLGASSPYGITGFPRQAHLVFSLSIPETNHLLKDCEVRNGVWKGRKIGFLNAPHEQLLLQQVSPITF